MEECNHENCKRKATVTNDEYFKDVLYCTFHANKMTKEGRRKRKYDNRILTPPIVEKLKINRMEELKPKRMIFDANGEWVCWDELKKNFEALTKENEELSDNKAKAIRWAETEMRGRERMRKLYGQKIDEVTQLKAENKELRAKLEIATKANWIETP